MKSSKFFLSSVLFLVLAAGQLSLQVAQAHAALQQSTPAADAVVSGPQEIDLVFNEKLLPRASRVEILMMHGSSTMPIENFNTEIINDGRTLRAKLSQPLTAGEYRVDYRAVGSDNHPMTGSFSFTVR